MDVVLLASIVIFGLIVHMWFRAHANTVCEMKLPLDRLPPGFDGVIIFFITDIHRRIVSEEIIAQARGADMVIIGGDLTEKGVPFRRVERNIERLKQIGPVYFVWGNNDYETNYRRLDTLLREKGVTILDNTAVRLEANGDRVALLGVDDYGLERDRLDLALKDSPQGYRILVSHNPAIAETMTDGTGIRLLLSGHTHGGQIRLFGWGPREKGGIKHRNDLTVFISNGYGTTMLPLRLGAPAETHLITLKKGK